MTWLFFILASLSAWLTYNVSNPIQGPPRARVFGFFVGWVWGEAAPVVVLGHLIAVVLFGLGGAFSHPIGVIGLVVAALSCGALVNVYLGSARAQRTVHQALVDGLGAGYEADIKPEYRSRFLTGVRWEDFARPFNIADDSVETTLDIQFDREKGIDLNLDIRCHKSRPADAPVLLQIHGGGWTIGYKENQAIPLQVRLAANGWVCVNVDYRLSPHATFPEHLIDCKKAIKWVKENIHRYGGNPDFIIATGGSAGGHLCSLVALTANDPEYQPGFEDVDTTMAACVPFYGVYDFVDEHGLYEPLGLGEFLEQTVMKASREEAPEAYRRASPVHRITEDAPPFFIIHGDTDTLVPVEDARLFCERLRRVSKQPVLYAEIAGAQHAFDIFDCPRSQATTDAVERFVSHVHTRYLEEQASGKAQPAAASKKAPSVADESAREEAAPKKTAKKSSTKKAKASTSSKSTKASKSTKTTKAAKTTKKKTTAKASKKAEAKAETPEGTGDNSDSEKSVANLPRSKKESATRSRRKRAPKKAED